MEQKKVIRFDRKGVEEAAKIVRKGGVVVYPTDTIYGLGCDPMNEGAVERLFKIKGRGAKPIPILCDSYASAAKIIEMDDTASWLAEKHWPGALTIVGKMKAKLPFQIHQGTNTVGVRVPDLELCIDLISMCGGYITGTSANKSGEPTCRSADEAMRILGKSVDLVLDEGTLYGKASTVVSVVGGKMEILRQGSVDVLKFTPLE